MPNVLVVRAAPEAGKPLTGLRATLSGGTIDASARTFPLTGLAITSASGSLTAGTDQSVTHALTGCAATFAQGAITETHSSTIALTGHAATFTRGTLFPSWQLAGHRIVSSKGSIGAGKSIALTGRGISVVKGTPFISSLQLTTQALPAATVGQAYSFTPAATGGATPYVWSFFVESLNIWTINSSTGTLSCTPTVAKTEDLRLTVQDALGATTYRDYTLVVNPGIQLFMGLSFEGLALAAYRSTGPKTGWMDITGTDSVYGFSYPFYPGANSSPWGGQATTTDSIQLLWNYSQTDTVNSIIDISGDTKPAQLASRTRALQLRLTQPYVDAAATQTNYEIQPNANTPQGMLYTSRWLWLQTNMTTRGYFGWMLFWEFKTPDATPERFLVQISNPSWRAASPVWNFCHDEGGAGRFRLRTWMSATVDAPGGNDGIGQTYKMPIPLGRWFRLEIAYNRIDASGLGWFWGALTDPGHPSDANLQAGIQTFAKRGAFDFSDGGTIRHEGLNAIQATAVTRGVYLHCAYSDMTRSSSSTYDIRCTNIEVATSWPANATAHPANYL